MKIFADKWSKRSPVQAIIVIVSVLLAGCTEAEKTHEEIIREDLLVIIDALGASCGRVTDHEITDELAYTVHCETGDTYSISVNPEGMVQID